MDELRQERLVLTRSYIEACIAYSSHPGLAEDGVPSTPGRTEKVLETLLADCAAWARTEKSGHLSTRRSELKRAMQYAPIAALVKLSFLDKRLSSFDHGLSAWVSPITSRIHADYLVAGTVSGRVSCKKPNLQQIPRDRRFRELFVAAPGNVLVGGDFALMEMRAAGDGGAGYNRRPFSMHRHPASTSRSATALSTSPIMVPACLRAKIIELFSVRRDTISSKRWRQACAAHSVAACVSSWASPSAAGSTSRPAWSGASAPQAPARRGGGAETAERQGSSRSRRCGRSWRS